MMVSLLDHVKISARDLSASKAFYEQALMPLDYTLVVAFETAAGFGVGGKPDFWIHGGDPGDSVHIAFRANNRAAVDGFYAAAVAAGGQDNGGPGLRPYHPSYYGAFVLDPDGHNIEAVCHDSA